MKILDKCRDRLFLLFWKGRRSGLVTDPIHAIATTVSPPRMWKKTRSQSTQTTLTTMTNPPWWFKQLPTAKPVCISEILKSIHIFQSFTTKGSQITELHGNPILKGVFFQQQITVQLSAKPAWAEAVAWCKALLGSSIEPRAHFEWIAYITYQLGRRNYIWTRKLYLTNRLILHCNFVCANLNNSQAIIFLP